MEEIKIQENTQKKKHLFYCDNCKKYLGETEEYEDGYYDKISTYEIDIKVTESVLYKSKKCLCTDCRENYRMKISELMNRKN